VPVRLPVVAALLLASVAGLGGVLASRPPALSLDGLPKGALNAQELRTTTVRVQTPSRPSRLLVDGRVLDRADDGSLRAPLGALTDGRHVLSVEVDRRGLPGSTTARRVLLVDTVPPVLTVDGQRGTARDVLHLATDDGRDVEVAPDGTFAVPPGARVLTGYDDAGNRTDLALAPTGR
jgi:hypothetical protein